MKKTISNNIVLLLSITLIMISSQCSEVKKKEASGPKESEKISQEEFEVFFDQFSKDSVFQLSRIEFPISYYLIDILDNEEEYVYTKEEFGYIDFEKDKAAFKSKTNAYRPLVEKITDTEAIYIKQGIDNGIRIEYYFERDDNGKWNMVKVKDNSV